MKRFDIAAGTKGIKYSVVFNKLGATIFGEENRSRYVRYADISEINDYNTFSQYKDFILKTGRNHWSTNIILSDIDETSCKKLMHEFNTRMDLLYSVSTHQ